MRLNKKIIAIEESQTLKLNNLAKELADSGRKIFNLTAGELDFDTPGPVRSAVRLKLGQNKYTPAGGTAELRKAIAGEMNRAHGLKLSGNNIFVTAGAKQALFSVFTAILNRGDEVIVPIPAWVSYEHQIRLAGGTPVFVPLTPDFDIDPVEVIKRLSLRTKAVMINSPHNPTGSIFSRKKLAELAVILKEKDIFIISDEIYRTLSYEKAEVMSDLARDLANLVVIDGFSKSHALTGWRIGFIAAENDIIDSVNRFIGHVSGNTSVISQTAGLACLKNPGITEEYVSILKKRMILAAGLLNGVRGLSYRMPRGAFYIFADIRKITKNSDRFCAELLEQEGTAIIPGESFRAPGFVRISFAASERTIKEGLSGLKKYTERL